MANIYASLTRLHESLAQLDESLRDIANDLPTLPKTDARNNLTDGDIKVDIIESRLQAMEKRLVDLEDRVCKPFVCRKLKLITFVVSLHLPRSPMQTLCHSQSQHPYLAGVDWHLKSGLHAPSEHLYNYLTHLEYC